MVPIVSKRWTARGVLRRVSGESGQAVVEFALVIPVFLLLLLGLVVFARAWSVHHAIADAAREGARTAVLPGPAITADSVRKLVQNRLRLAGLDPAAASLTVSGIGGDTGTPTKVQLRYPFHIPFLRGGSGSSSGKSGIVLSTSVVMRHE